MRGCDRDVCVYLLGCEDATDEVMDASIMKYGLNTAWCLMGVHTALTCAFIDGAIFFSADFFDFLLKESSSALVVYDFFVPQRRSSLALLENKIYPFSSDAH